ncbi:hypothetical protein X798_00557 [Onchocerca flexuosa]|uniref:Serine hydroxymethyltransferase-like domain-containing protein n=1 Tax=Onchocerca flexuosa TaxID=387005 RepID=A0A238C644_9BILA|nr:hypothetical protein X798_00557 [Onchocerca flexuosa]
MKFMNDTYKNNLFYVDSFTAEEKSHERSSKLIPVEKCSSNETSNLSDSFIWQEWMSLFYNQSAVFPGLQGGPLMHVIAAKAVAFKKALAPEFRTYSKKLLRMLSISSSSARILNHIFKAIC